MHYLRSFFSFVFIFGTVCAAQQENQIAEQHRFDEIAPEYLSVFPLAQQKDHRDEKGKSGLDFSVPSLSEREIASLSLAPLKSDERLLSLQPASSISDKSVWQGVRLYANQNQNPADTVVGALNPITQIGRLVMSRMLTDLTRDVATLQERQNLIELLASDDHEFEKYSSLLEKFRKQEGNLLAMLRSSDTIRDPQLTRLLGHQKGFAPLSAFGKAHAEVMTIPMSLIMPAIGGFSLYFLKEQLANVDNNPALGNRGRRLLKAGAYLMPLYLMSTPLILWFAIMQNKKVYLYVKQRLRALHYLTQTLTRIEEFDLPIIGPQVDAILEQRSKTAESFAKALADKRLRKNSWFAEWGVNVYRSIDAISDGGLKKITRGLHIIGQLDAYLAIARLMREHAGKQATYCFTEYLSAPNAQITAEHFWHPNIPADSAVTNSLSLGKKGEPRGLVLTGVNEGGKSTAMRALALCLVLGQTFGVAPAQHFAFTPFSIIRMSMNTIDDLDADKSLFKTEIDKAHHIIKELDTLPADEHSIYFLDEIFTGTERVEGEAAAYAIARRLITHPRCLILLATHYPGLTHLEADTHGAYKNMHVAVNIADGVFSYPYRLQPGPTTQQIAIDILAREKFDPIIVDMARRVLASPNEFIPTSADK